MAWSHLYGTATTRIELLNAIKNFMIGIGWTVADDYLTAANPFIALKSNGENGQRSHGILFELTSTNSIFTTVFRTWEPIAPTIWTPGTGNSVSGSQTLTKSSGAPSFLDYFSVGDSVAIFNNISYNTNSRRSIIQNLTSSVMTLSAQYPYPSLSFSATSSLMISKGGPFIHARGTSYYNGGTIYTVDASHQYFIYGDLDTIIVITRGGTLYYHAYIGRYDPAYPEIISLSLSEVTAGTSTSIEVEDGSLFKIGTKYAIGNSKHMHAFTVTNIIGNTIYFTDGLTNGVNGIVYEAGSELGQCLNPICSAGFSTVNSTGCTCVVPGSVTFPYFNDVNNIVTGSGQGVSREITDLYGEYLTTALSPDTRNGSYGFFKKVIYGSSNKELFGFLRNVYMMRTQVGNNEDYIRLGDQSGPTYKLFNLQSNTNPWYAIKE